MNLREKRTNFLKDCYQIYKNNPCPKEEFTNIIYNLLKCYNNVISEDIEYYFPYWINRSKEHYKKPPYTNYYTTIIIRKKENQL